MATETNAPIKVLIVDDSALVRRLLTEMLNNDPRLEVVGTAQDPYIARKKIKEFNPDVITLDIEMPRMDGLAFLEKLMKLRPMPVVMVSSLTEKGAETTFRAMELGAVDFVSKPKVDIAHTLNDYAEEICNKVKAAAGAHIRPLVSPPTPPSRHGVDTVIPKTDNIGFKTTQNIIAIGASTGGTEAIKALLIQMPPDAPGIVITQHIPEMFSTSFARRLNLYTDITVTEAENNEQILSGHAYLAPGNRHLLVKRDGARFRCLLDSGAPINRHRPSVDVLFRSVAQSAGFNAVGVILTGMGSDGAQGMLELHNTGAITIAQDENSSIVWGMPGAAVKLDAVDAVLPLSTISNTIISHLKGHKQITQSKGIQHADEYSEQAKR